MWLVRRLLVVGICCSFVAILFTRFPRASFTTTVPPPARKVIDPCEDRLFIAIQSDNSARGAMRRTGARKTWLRWIDPAKADYRFFVDGKATDEHDVVALETSSSTWNLRVWRSLRWTPPHFSAFLAINDDSLLCIHRIIEELARRPKERFVWSRYNCNKTSKLKPGFLAMTRDVAQFLATKISSTHADDIGALFSLLDLTLLDDPERLVDDPEPIREWALLNRQDKHFCQEFVWAGSLTDEKNWWQIMIVERPRASSIIFASNKSYSLSINKSDSLSNNKTNSLIPNRTITHQRRLLWTSQRRKRSSNGRKRSRRVRASRLKEAEIPGRRQRGLEKQQHVNSAVSSAARSSVQARRDHLRETLDRQLEMMIQAGNRKRKSPSKVIQAKPLVRSPYHNVTRRYRQQPPEEIDFFSKFDNVQDALFQRVDGATSMKVKRSNYAVLSPVCHQRSEKSRELKRNFALYFLDVYEEKNTTGLESEYVRESLHSCSFDIDCLWSALRETVIRIWWSEIDDMWATMCRPETLSVLRSCGKFRERTFQQGERRNTSAVLASFPGSGNTWSRLLLEYGSGLFTGSIYDDIDLMKALPAEGAFGHEVLAVKAHVLPSQYLTKTRATRVLLLVRHPFDAIWAEYQRRQSGGGHASVVELSSQNVEAFGRFARCMACKWLRYTVIHANMAFASTSHQLLVIRYEDLARNTVATLERMLIFLGVEGTTTERLRCAKLLSHDPSIKRTKKVDAADVVFKLPDKGCSVWRVFVSTVESRAWLKTMGYHHPHAQAVSKCLAQSQYRSMCDVARVGYLTRPKHSDSCASAGSSRFTSRSSLGGESDKKSRRSSSAALATSRLRSVPSPNEDIFTRRGSRSSV